MTQRDAYIFWFGSAKSNRTVAYDNYRLGHFDWALFFYHLTLEKLLKGIMTKNGDIPPPTHDLLKLAKRANIDPEESYKEYFKEITTYNIEARYDDYKRSFYKKATKVYAKKWMDICEEIYIWLQKYI